MKRIGMVGLVATLALLGLSARQVAAQSPPPADVVASAARELVVDLRAAANRGDWEAMRPFFPPGSDRWTTMVERIVSGADDPKYSSFWRPGTELADSIRTEVIAQDIVAVLVNFRNGNEHGLWGAVVVKDINGWRLHCTVETFNANAPWRPGCMGPRNLATR